MSDVSEDVIVQWTRENAQKINERVLELDELKEELGAESVEWSDNPYEQKPPTEESLRRVLQDMQSIAADLRREVLPSSVLGELLDERNKHLDMFVKIANWMDTGSPVVEQACEILAEKAPEA